jgi:hypothetical protein
VSQTRSFAVKLANIPGVIASDAHSYGYGRGLEEEREGSRWGGMVWGRGAITRTTQVQVLLMSGAGQATPFYTINGSQLYSYSR